MNSVHGPSFLASFITSIIESPSTVECFCEEKKTNRTLYCLPVCLSACLTFSYQFSSACCPGIHCEHTETITYRKNLLFVIPLKWDEDDFLLGMKNPSRIQETNHFLLRVCLFIQLEDDFGQRHCFQLNSLKGF